MLEVRQKRYEEEESMLALMNSVPDGSEESEDWLTFAF